MALILRIIKTKEFPKATQIQTNLFRNYQET